MALVSGFAAAACMGRYWNRGLHEGNDVPEQGKQQKYFGR